MKTFHSLVAGTLVAASVFGSYQLAQQGRVPVSDASAVSDALEHGMFLRRTMVVSIGSSSPVKAVNGLIFALHSLRNARGDFGGTPFQLEVKVVFGGEGVLHATDKIEHPEIRIATLPDDPIKRTDTLIAALIAEGVEMRATRFGLKHFDVADGDLLPGVVPGGANDVPRFIASPQTRNVYVVNF